MIKDNNFMGIKIVVEKCQTCLYACKQHIKEDKEKWLNCPYCFQIQDAILFLEFNSKQWNISSTIE